MHVPGSHSLEVSDTLSNNGLIMVNPTGTSSTTTLRADGDLVLHGEGELLLRRYSVSTPAGITTTQPDAVLFHGSGHTMRGVGVIGMEVENFDTLHADASAGSGGELHIGPVSNDGLVSALHRQRSFRDSYARTLPIRLGGNSSRLAPVSAPLPPLLVESDLTRPKRVRHLPSNFTFPLGCRLGGT